MIQKKNRLLLLLCSCVCLLLYNNCAQPFSSIDSQASSSNQANSDGSLDDSSPTGDQDSSGDDSAVIPDPENAGPALMAIGHMQMTMYSCDGGRTWEGYQSANNNQRCWDRNADDFDCDHDSTSGKGVTWGEDGFMATFGWGTPGQVIKTTDGTNWTPVHQGATFAGVSYGNSTYYLNSRRNNLVSQDGGSTWTEAGDVLSTPFNQRQTFFIPGGGGRFVSLSSSGGVVDMMISRDNGLSFVHPDVLPEGCGEGAYAIGQQSIIVNSDITCVSSDNGDTWVPAAAPGNGQLLFNGEEFRSYGRGHFMRTPDGVINWTRVDVTLNGAPANNLELRHVTYQPQLNRYSANNQRWQNWYESTEFYWSDDGIDWHIVDKAAGDAPLSPHPIRAIASGFLETCSTSDSN